MVTWLESIFIPMPEGLVSIVILVEILGGVRIVLGGLIGLFASQAGHFITRLSALFLVILMLNVFYIGHPDWFVWHTMKLLTSEQMFLFVISISFWSRGNT